MVRRLLFSYESFLSPDIYQKKAGDRALVILPGLERPDAALFASLFSINPSFWSWKEVYDEVS
jgi:hypothetical protein